MWIPVFSRYKIQMARPDGLSKRSQRLDILRHLEWHRVASVALQLGGLWRRRKPQMAETQTAKLKGETGQTVPFQIAKNGQAVRFDEPSGFRTRRKQGSRWSVFNILTCPLSRSTTSTPQSIMPT